MKNGKNAVAETGAFKPREWQGYAADQCVWAARSGADRILIYACPGSGKTVGGLLSAQKLIQRVRKTNAVIVLTPNLAIKTQWIARAQLMGMELRELKTGRELLRGELPFGIQGYILSYQQAINLRNSLKVFCETFNPIVILDEVHHTATSDIDKDGNVWGVSVEKAFAAASFKICTTGTPFREGNNPIAFVHYNEAGKADASVRYPYAKAIQDGICRPIEFEFYDGSIAWNGRSADFQETLSKKLSRERLNAALSTDGDFPFKLLSGAHERLLSIRAGSGVDSNAGGIAVAINEKHADAIADVLEGISGERPIVVHSKIDDAQDRIEAFRSGQQMWIVGIQMLSEGLDIPRLRVGAYCTRIKAPLYFHQFCGRVMRVQDSRNERAFIAMPRDPELVAIAREIEEERIHALGEDDQETIGRKGSGTGRGRMVSLDVEHSDGRAVATAISGFVFPREYIDRHRQVADDFKRKNPALHTTPVAEILKWLIQLDVIEPPKGEAA